MTYRTIVGVSFVGILFLVLGFLFLPWSVAPIGPHYNLFLGPTGWTNITLPITIHTHHPDLIGWTYILLFWMLALLILFEFGSGVVALQRQQTAPIGRIYRTSSQFGLALILLIVILTLIGLADLGWQSFLFTFGGLGFWACFIGFLIIRQAGTSLRDSSR